MLHDLMRPEFVTLFANLLGTDPYGGTAPQRHPEQPPRQRERLRHRAGRT